MKPAAEILPTIHKNGTGAETLRDGYEAAYRACVAAQETIRKIEFNARDYYPQGPEAFDRARQEWNRHYLAIVAAGEYYIAIAGHAVDAIAEKE